MPERSPLRRLAALTLLLAASRPGSAGAEPGAPDSLGQLHPGAIEVGLAGSLTAVEGQARATLALRCGSFAGTCLGLRLPGSSWWPEIVVASTAPIKVF